ncbi:hypothetical protein OG883_16595 [Streptomyces sp. NBC_01142]|uniref:hypothetical protein n=1 Tax=Streptomyces sp. NBC_01142 TaxID=2975865 RepID=UPI00225BFDB1|nr:hypothetical protein [Streptomyces sp. NBC_01142]MCX4821487.1 hypothetical protein [Streptomyces sp. NBC_01142]
MRIGKKVTVALLAGALVGTVSGCSSGSPKDDAPGTAAKKPTDVALTSEITPPPGFASEKGWEVRADWMPEGQPFPYAVSAKGDTIAYLDKTTQGYVLKVREAMSGRLLSTSKPWKAPELTEEQTEDPSGLLTVPRVSLITGGEREYFAVWAYGKKSKDQLHNTKEVISAAFYPADASGDIGPSGTADVGASAEDSATDVNVFPGAGGLVVIPRSEDAVLLSPEGKVTHGIAKVKLGGKPSDLDINIAIPSPDGLVTNGKLEQGGSASGGFGIDGGWHSTTVIPPGASAVLKGESASTGPWETPNGRINSATGNHLIAGWYTTADSPMSAVHDLATGKLRATASCEIHGTPYDLRAPEQADPYETPASLSPNGQYLVKDRSVFNLKTGKGHCIGGGEDAKRITLISVGDDGTAYGLTERSGPEGNMPVSVSAETGAAEPLPVATTTPDAVAKGAGVFITYGSQYIRLIVLNARN